MAPQLSASHRSLRVSVMRAVLLRGLSWHTTPALLRTTKQLQLCHDDDVGEQDDGRNLQLMLLESLSISQLYA